MDNNDFETLTELYNRLYPAFVTKCDELKKIGINVSVNELWNFLKNNVWSNAKDLELYQIVDDILKLDINKFIESRKLNEN